MATQVVAGGSLRVPMTYAAYRALGETKHHEYYDGMCVINPPSRRHAVVARRLTRVLEDACPTGYDVIPEWGWRVRLADGRHRLAEPFPITLDLAILFR